MRLRVCVCACVSVYVCVYKYERSCVLDCLLDLDTQDVTYLVNSFLPLAYVDGGFASLHLHDRQPCLTPV